ncbi:hypothetical protein Cgig2_027669 [Carnegiea gigantea]|uniref:Uncharacterized protein n=1 Tax=Carnegiea gigantea TaxID=171969 RepID=A0A9Q1Q5H3_9CARY|nr:hypothetical protein Cgig2_027669 [Carnegiea gigantea]
MSPYPCPIRVVAHCMVMAQEGPQGTAHNAGHKDHRGSKFQVAPPSVLPQSNSSNEPFNGQGHLRLLRIAAHLGSPSFATLFSQEIMDDSAYRKRESLLQGRPQVELYSTEIVATIAGGYINGISHPIWKAPMCKMQHVMTSKKGTLLKAPIMNFSEIDCRGLITPHDDPLVVELKVVDPLTPTDVIPIYAMMMRTKGAPVQRLRRTLSQSYLRMHAHTV